MRPNDIDIEKKRPHCLRNCLITFIVMTVLILGGLFGGAYYAYGRFAEPILGISMFDAFGVLGGIGKYNEKKIVTNPYSEEDRLAFYANLENATCLDLPEDFKISTAVNEVLASKAQQTPEGGDPNVPPEVPPVDPSQPDPMPMADVDVPGQPTPPDPAPVEPEDPFQSIKDFKTGNEYLDTVLRDTGFDFSQLKDFNGEGKDLTLTDRQLAAVIDEVVSNLSLPELDAMLEKWGLALADIVRVRQVTISGVPSVETALAESEPVPTPGVDTPASSDPLSADVKISLVICINLDKNVANILKAEAPSVPPILADMASGILPKKIFVGAGVYYSHDTTKKLPRPEIFVNGIAGKVMDNLLTAVDGILKQSNPDSGVDAMLDKVSSVVAETIHTMEDMVGELRFVDSSLEMDPIALLMNVLKVNVPDPNTGSIEHYINSSNFFMMLKHLYNTDNSVSSLDEATLKEYIAKNVGADNIIDKDSYTRDLQNLSEAYGIVKTADFDMSAWTPADFMTKFKDIPAHIDVVGAEMNGKHIYDVTQAEMVTKTMISDNAIGYMVNDLITTKLKESLAGLPFDMQVASFVLYEPEGNAGAVMARFTAGVNTKKLSDDLLASNAVLSKIITSAIPHNIFLEVEVPITIGAGTPGLVLNFLGRDGKGDGISKEEMDKGYSETKEAFGTLVRILAAFDKPTADKLEIESLLAMLDTKIKEMLVQLEGQLSDLLNKGTVPAPAPAMAAGDGTAPVDPPAEPNETPIVNKLIKAGGIQMPTVYEIIKVFAGNDSGVKAEDVQVALSNMYTFTTENAQSSAVIDDFITRELEGKLFMINNLDPVTNEKEINATNVFTAMQSLGTKVESEGVGAVINARGLIEDTTHPTVESLRLSVKATELAAVLNSSDQISSISGSMPYASIAATEGANIVKVGSDYYMNITLKLSDIDATKAIEGVGILYKNLLPAEVYVKANIKMTGTPEDIYTTKIYINSISDTTKATIDKILSNLMKDEAGNATVSFAKIESTIAEQMKNALKSLESSGQSLSFNAVDGGSIVAMSIYDVIYDQVMKAKIDTLLTEGKITEADATAIRGADGKQGPTTVMTIFKKLLANTKVTHIDGVTLDALATDLGDKMLLADGVLDGKDLFGSITNITDTSTGENIFAKLDTSKLWTKVYNNPNKMNIEIQEAELLTIMREKVATLPFELPEICAKPINVESLDVTNNALSAVLSVGINHASTDASFKQILPFMPAKIVLKVDMNLETGKEKTTLLMNDLDIANMQIANTLLTVMTADNGASAFDLDAITKTIDDQIKGVFKTMTDVGLSLTFGDEKVTSGNVFDVIVKSDPKFATITPEELHLVLYKGLDPNATTNVVAGDDLVSLSEGLNDKMLLSDGTIDANDMFGSISKITDTTGGKNVFDSLATSKLWDPTKNYDVLANMNIKIEEGEMVTIMRAKMATIELTNLPPIFKAPYLNNIVIGLDRLSMELNIPINKESTDPNYKDILSFMPEKMVISVDMNVKTGEVNMLMNSLEETDKAMADKVLSIFNFKMSDITTEMGVQITKVLDIMKNVGLELQFNAGAPAGNVTSGNIFDVIVNADRAKFGSLVADADPAVAAKKSASALHTVLYYGLDPNATEKLVVGDNLTALTNSLNDKLLLADGTIKADTMLDSISGITDDIFGSVEFTKLWTEDPVGSGTYKRTYPMESDMNITIKEGEMLSIMRDKMDNIAVANLPSICKAPKINNIKVGDNSLDIELNIAIDKTSTDPNYKDVLSFMPAKLVLHMTIDMVGNNHKLLLNSLDEDGVPEHDNHATVTKVFSTMGFDIENIASTMGTKVKDTLAIMENAGLALTFKASGDIETGNIYDIIKKADKESKFTSTKAELHSMLTNLFAPKSEKDKMIINGKPAIAPEEGKKVGVTLSGSDIVARISDYYISNGVFTGEIKNTATDKPIGKVVQMAILSTGKGLEKAKSTFKGYMDSMTRGILLGVEVETASYNTSAKTGFGKVIPTSLMVSILLDIPAGITNTNDIVLTPVINNMSVADMATLNKVLGDGGMVEKITKELNTSVLGVEIPITYETTMPKPATYTKKVKLSEILISPSTTYENVYNGIDNTGIFGNIVYTKPVSDFIKP